MNVVHYNQYPWNSHTDYRKNPCLYKIGRGEQGVLICQPYKSELLPYWKFRNPDVAKKSSDKIYQMFLAYLRDNDFVGADLSRKYLQMGFTRSKRYANFKGGKKFDSKGDLLPKNTGSAMKNQSAKIFLEKYRLACSNAQYIKMKKRWQTRYKLGGD